MSNSRLGSKSTERSIVPSTSALNLNSQPSSIDSARVGNVARKTEHWRTVKANVSAELEATSRKGSAGTTPTQSQERCEFPLFPPESGGSGRR